jgi:hypothetical protein
MWIELSATNRWVGQQLLELQAERKLCHQMDVADGESADSFSGRFNPAMYILGP